MRAKFINEALSDILKPKLEKDILNDIKHLNKNETYQYFIGALIDGNIQLADLIYKNNNISHNKISGFLDWMLQEYSDNISSIHYAKTISPPLSQQIFDEYKEYLNRLKNALTYLESLNLPFAIREKILNIQSIE